MRDRWTDERLDDFRGEWSLRPSGVEREIRQLRTEMHHGFDAVHRTLMQIVGATVVTVTAGFGGVIATQL